MQRRRQLMGIQNAFPSIYQRVEYLESTGTQFIDSGIRPNKDTWVHTKLYTISSGNKNWFGSGYGGGLNSTSFSFNSFNSNTLEYTYGDKLWSRISYNNATNRILDIYFAKNSKIIINNETVIDNIGTFIGSSVNSILVFKRANGSALVSGRLFFFKIYSNDDLVLDLIPCIRKSDDKPGMYDTVTKQFYTNAGTGEFIVPN